MSGSDRALPRNGNRRLDGKQQRQRLRDWPRVCALDMQDRRKTTTAIQLGVLSLHDLHRQGTIRARDRMILANGRGRARRRQALADASESRHRCEQAQQRKHNTVVQTAAGGSLGG